MTDQFLDIEETEQDLSAEAAIAQVIDILAGAKSMPLSSSVIVSREDVTGLLAEAAAGHLRTDPRPTSASAVCVVLASEGYPTAPRTGDPIEGLERAAVLPDVNVLHAGTGSDDQGRLVTAGGRVLGVTATGPSAGDARKKAYAAVDVINWDGMQYRRDIAAGIGTGERS